MIFNPTVQAIYQTEYIFRKFHFIFLAISANYLWFFYTFWLSSFNFEDRLFNYIFRFIRLVTFMMLPNLFWHLCAFAGGCFEKWIGCCLEHWCIVSVLGGGTTSTDLHFSDRSLRHRCINFIFKILIELSLSLLLHSIFFNSLCHDLVIIIIFINLVDIILNLFKLGFVQEVLIIFEKPAQNIALFYYSRTRCFLIHFDIIRKLNSRLIINLYS